jgi:hypothetical protein
MTSRARRIDVAAGTQDTALQIAWISSKPLVCSFRRPVTKSVYDIKIGFSSVTCVSVRSAATGPERSNSWPPPSKVRCGMRHHEICINRAA